MAIHKIIVPPYDFSLVGCGLLHTLLVDEKMIIGSQHPKKTDFSHGDYLVLSAAESGGPLRFSKTHRVPETHESVHCCKIVGLQETDRKTGLPKDSVLVKISPVPITFQAIVVRHPTEKTNQEIEETWYTGPCYPSALWMIVKSLKKTTEVNYLCYLVDDIVLHREVWRHPSCQ
jgi:hypothetical protein